METIRFKDFDCICLENEALRLLVTCSVGPRIISLELRGGDNLLAVLPDFVTKRPDGKDFHFYGGHRLWHAPESMPRTYSLDDAPVRVMEAPGEVSFEQQMDEETGIQKCMSISLVSGAARVIVRHTLRNGGLQPVELAPWAITQFRTGGAAILPQSQEQTDILPNRKLALWSYTSINCPQVCWGDRFILVKAQMQSAFKVGFANPRGWLAYWLDGTLFVKRAAFERQAAYYDYGSSSECYCNAQFLELETLAPIQRLGPQEAAVHTETWELYGNIPYPEDEHRAQEIVERLGLE